MPLIKQGLRVAQRISPGVLLDDGSSVLRYVNFIRDDKIYACRMRYFRDRPAEWEVRLPYPDDYLVLETPKEFQMYKPQQKILCIYSCLGRVNLGSDFDIYAVLAQRMKIAKQSLQCLVIGRAWDKATFDLFKESLDWLDELILEHGGVWDSSSYYPRYEAMPHVQEKADDETKRIIFIDDWKNRHQNASQSCLSLHNLLP